MFLRMLAARGKAQFAGLTMIGAVACAPGRSDLDAETLGTGEQLTALGGGEQLGRVFSAGVVNGKRTAITWYDLPASAYGVAPATKPKTDALPATSPPERIQGKLASDLAEVDQGRSPDRRVTVIVTFVEDQKLPRFPAARIEQPRDAPDNVEAASDAESLVEEIKRTRGPNQDAMSKDLLASLDARERERFWLFNGMVLDLPLSRVRGLLARENVQYVEYDLATAAGWGSTGHISDGRILLGTDNYPSRSGYIGIIDSGIRSGHNVLSNPNVYDYRRDCVHGTSGFCTVGTGLDPEDDLGCFNGAGHGTALANIVAGNTNLGDPFLGVTDMTVDSWKVWPDCGGNPATLNLFLSAVGRAFQGAVAALDSVITTSSYQSNASETGSFSTAADAAFDSGSVVVALAGNFGPTASSVTAPGNAQKVLAIGAFDVTTWALESFSGRGPVPTDGRIKPDLIAPDNVYVASASSNTATTPNGSGTSYATPFAAGAAGLVWNMVGATNFPGLTNAMMINGGTNRAFDNNLGAGWSQIPPGGLFWWGGVTVTQGQFVSIPFNVGTGAPTNHVNAAIWWPEAPGTHNDVDLELWRPDGVLMDSSISSPSIFEKVSATTGLQAGTWKVRLHGFAVTGTQTVYYAIHKL